MVNTLVPDPGAGSWLFRLTASSKALELSMSARSFLKSIFTMVPPTLLPQVG